MSDTVKLIIEIPKAPKNDHERWVLAHGTSLDSNSERAEVQAYFDGQAYGWEEGRKALIEDLKAEIYRAYEDVTMYYCDEEVCSLFASKVSKILNSIGKAESEDKE